MGDSMGNMNRNAIKKAFPLLAELIHWFKRRKVEIPTIFRHLKRRRLQRKRINSHKEPIKVVFICQYIPAWSKNKALYDAMVLDQRFTPYLLCIPNRIHGNQLDHPDDLSNDAFDYFRSHGYSEAINALVGADEWFDLEALQPDYVVFNRYDRAMPLPYTSTAVSHYAKVCLVIYGCSLLKVEEKMIDNVFASNTFCFFAESESIRKYFLSMNSLLARLKLSRAVFCGIPAIENAWKAQNAPCPAWDFSRNRFRAIYAPRWTTDATWGGSSFFLYKDSFFQIADALPDIDILVRPHPLMFDHFVQTGLITQKDVQSYRQSCLDRPNIRLDQEKEYLATFWNSSVLICDYSSMMIEYFITGKPIIYLTYRDSIEYTDQMRAMLSGCYLVNNESELRQTLNDLLSGKDPLSARRTEVCEKELILTENTNASVNMMQQLWDGLRA